MEGVWFGFLVFGLFLIVALKEGGKPNDMKPEYVKRRLFMWILVKA